MAAKSASAYDELREIFKDSALILPSRRVLRDYTNVIPPKASFYPGVIKGLVQTTKGYDKYQRYVFILFDDMKIHAGKLDLGQTFWRTYRICDPDINFPTLEKSDDLASHYLMFIVRDITTTLKHILSYFWPLQEEL